VARYRIYVYRNRELRCLPGDYETLEDAKLIFEKHHGDTPRCLIGDVDPHSECPTFVQLGQAVGPQVHWQPVHGWLLG
jgi:hypothetical protein